jgi:predicted aconitase/predicted aconitase with swiveling domain
LPLTLDDQQRAIAGDRDGPGRAFAMGFLARFAEAVGARRLIPIASAHIDGCLWHGQVSLDFVNHLIGLAAKTAVPTTLNVGSADLVHGGGGNGAAEGRVLMKAHLQLGCLPSFTCAPYQQAASRPAFGAHVAWGESNAIAFANSVLGARTERYGDFIDLICAVAGFCPEYGLHLDENRRAGLLIRLDASARALAQADPALGSIAAGLIAGRLAEGRVPAIDGLPAATTEDDLKALGAAAASTGAVGLFHAVGLTPEASDLDAAFGGVAPIDAVTLSAHDLAAALAGLTKATPGETLAAVTLGTPHFSLAEFARLLPLVEAALAEGRRAAVPFFINTARANKPELDARGWSPVLAAFGAELVFDTCFYLGTIAPAVGGHPGDLRGMAVMTNSGKAACYGPANLGARMAFGGLAACVDAALEGRVPARPASPTPQSSQGRLRMAGNARVGEAGQDAEHMEDAPQPGIPPLISADVSGERLVLTAPLSFWGGVDPATGVIIDPSHPQCGASMAGRVLVLPAAKGSSSGSSVLAETLRRGVGPKAIVLGRPDGILLTGAMVAEMLYGGRE